MFFRAHEKRKLLILNVVETIELTEMTKFIESILMTDITKLEGRNAQT
jgi:hypothetical protein